MGKMNGCVLFEGTIFTFAWTNYDKPWKPSVEPISRPKLEYGTS